MNGTSIDAVDYAVIQSDNNLKKIKFKSHKQFSIPKPLRDRLLKAAKNQLKTYEISILNYDLGRLYAKHIKQLKKSWKWDIVGLHGQTVHHEGKRSTLQIGHPGFLSKETSKPIVFDFRSNDIVMGGQGAPFAPFFQKALGESLSEKNFAFHNLGGISNLTFFQDKKTRAFDTGPANILMDAWIQKRKKKAYDKGGKWASQGLPAPMLVNKMLTHPYFKKISPKSCGREEFNLDFILKYGGKAFQKLSFEDQMATLLELTAISIADGYKSNFKKQPEQIFFYGGGVYNPQLLKRIQYSMPHCKLKTTDEIGWPTQAFEASTFAFLALAKLLHKKVHIPQVTGASSACHLGSYYSL